MYDFTGVQCPVCKQAFTEASDLVVCPECGAPYHRACYEQVGACLYADKHAERFEWQPPHAPRAEAPAQGAANAHAPIHCPTCGQSNPSGSRYCSKCGTGLGGTPQYARRPGAQQAAASVAAPQYGPGPQAGSMPNPFAVKPDERFEGISAADWRAYIGASAESYLQKFKLMQLSGRKVSFSLGALFFGPFYFVYRKAWKPAIFFGILQLLLELPAMLLILAISESPLLNSVSTDLLTTLTNVAAIFSWVVLVLRGSYGLYFYQKNAAERIRRIQNDYPNEQQRGFVLRAQGGTSIVAAVLVFVVVFALLFVGVTSFCGPNLNAVLAYAGMQ